MEFNSDQRKARIIELLNENGEVKVSALSKMFGISEVTIRFDLEALENEGLLSRVYGGAVSSGKLYHEMDLKQRFSANEAEKKAIAEQIASMINNNDTIMMNAGTTLTYVLRALKGSGTAGRSSGAGRDWAGWSAPARRPPVRFPCGFSVSGTA